VDGWFFRALRRHLPAVPPLSQGVPNDIAPNLFNSVGTVEISEYREPNSPILTARRGFASRHASIAG
jgi:hypothetical protein